MWREEGEQETHAVCRSFCCRFQHSRFNPSLTELTLPSSSHIYDRLDSAGEAGGQEGPGVDVCVYVVLLLTKLLTVAVVATLILHMQNQAQVRVLEEYKCG